MFRNLRQLFGNSRPHATAPSGLNAALTADLVVNLCCFENFRIPDTAMETNLDKLPAELTGHRGVAAMWIQIFLTWELHRELRETHGGQFCDSVMSNIHERLSRTDETTSVSDSIRYWFNIVDHIAARPPQQVAGQQIPAEYFVAVAFLGLSHDSPFHGQTEGFGGADFDLAEALIQARVETAETRRAVVERAPFAT